ncbi:MAG: 4-oxalocrotonate tautomerase family protein [Gammaproteobacteria bacterium]
MPLVQITILQGRPTAQKHRLLREITAVMSDVLGSPKERIRVCINEVHPDCWGIAGEPASQVRATEIKARAAAARKQSARQPATKPARRGRSA